MSHLSNPFIRRLALTGGSGNLDLTGVGKVRVISESYRPFKVSFSQVDLDAEISSTVPAGAYAWESPVFEENQALNLFFEAGVDIEETGQDQILEIEIWRVWIDVAKILSFEGNVPVFTVEIIDPSDSSIVAKYSDLGWSSDTHLYYDPLILGVDNLKWSINLDNLQPNTIIPEVKLYNEDNVIAQLAADTRDLFGLEIQLDLRYRIEGVEIVTSLYRGFADIEKSSATVYKLKIIPFLSERLGRIQKTVNVARFTNARVEDINKGSNILSGTFSSATGAIYAPVVDDSTVYLEASQDYIKSVTAVFRKRAGVFTAVAFASSYAQDNFGDFYTRITINPSLYQQGDEFYFNGTGIEATGDGSGALITNPASQLKEISIRYTGLVDADFDTTSWNAFIAKYSGFTNSTIIVPWKKSEILPIINNLYSEVAFSFDVAFYINYDGQIAVATDNNVATQTADLDTLTNYSAEENLSVRDISTDKPEIQYYNGALVNYGVNQSADNQVIDDYNIQDSGSVAFYGGLVNAEISSTFVTDETESLAIASPELLRAAGKSKRVNYPAVNMDILQSVPGERVTITHPLANVEELVWNQKEVLIETISLDHLNLSTQFDALTVGNTFGPILQTGEIAVVIPFDVDIWINSQLPDTNYKDDVQIRVGDNLDSLGVGYWNYASRVDLSAYIPGGATVIGATYSFYTDQGNNDGNPPVTGRTNPPINGQLLELTATDWTNESTWNNFDNGIEKAIRLDGITKRAGGVNPASLQLTTAATFNFRTIPDTVTGTQGILNKIGTVAPDNVGGYRCGFDNDEVAFRGMGGSAFTITTNNSPVDLAGDQSFKITYDGSVPEVIFYARDFDESVYVEIARATNGTQTNCVLSGTIPATLLIDNTNLDVGIYRAAGNAPANYYDGKIAWLGIANFVDVSTDDLTAGECVVYYDFESNLNDTSGNGHTLTGVDIVAGDYVDVISSTGVPWNDSMLDTTVLAQSGKLKSTGWKDLALTAAGVAYLQANIAGDINWSFNLGRIGAPQAGDDLNEWLKIASYKSTTHPYFLRVVYVI